MDNNATSRGIIPPPQELTKKDKKTGSVKREERSAGSTQPGLGESEKVFPVEGTSMLTLAKQLTAGKSEGWLEN